MKRRTLLAGSIGAATLVALVPAPARATNFSGATGFRHCQGVNAADNGNHFVWYNDVVADTSAAMQWTRVNNYDPTAVDTYYDSAWNSTTDVVVHDYDYTGDTCDSTWMAVPGGTGMAGIAPCQTLLNQVCQQFFIYYDNDFMGPSSSSQERSLACHELGHSLGLKHWTSGCMIDSSTWPTSLTTHDESHLDGFY